MLIDAKNMDFRELNDRIRSLTEDVTLSNVCGQRFIGAGSKGIHITISGVPGNALGCYLNGSDIEVNANVQDAVGDTMNSGSIIVRGNIGDAAGYAMRGGSIYVQGNAGYRAGIHMKAYREKKPCIVIGGRTGSFLGEYQAGGQIIVLGLHTDGKPIVGNFPGTGMHGGKMYLRSDCNEIRFPSQVTARAATEQDMKEIEEHLKKYCGIFGFDYNTIRNAKFTVIVPDSKNPYTQMYCPK